MSHDPRLIAYDDKIEELKKTIPDWIKRLERPATPCVVPAFGPLEGIRAVGTGVFIAALYRHEAGRIRRGGDPYRTSRRRCVPLLRAAIDPRPPPARMRRGRSHQE